MDRVADSGPVMVTVKCYTYNQAPYIRRCLDGFVMQKTDFRFEVLVHDDASTDGTAKIVKEYAERWPDLIIPVCEEENLYSRGGMGAIYEKLEPMVRGRYLAFCEGDDCWTDPDKLQMQVDFLEGNPEYGLCYTQSFFRYASRGSRPDHVFGGPSVTCEELMRDGNCIPTATVLIRTELDRRYNASVRPFTRGWKMGDYPKWIWVSHESKVMRIERCTAEYHARLSSASHFSDSESRIAFLDNTVGILRFFEDLIGMEKGLYSDDIRHARRRLFYYATAHRLKPFLSHLLASRRLRRDLHSILLLRYFFLPRKKADRV